MKRKYNIYGSGWSETDAANVSKNIDSIEWVVDGSAQDSFYPNTMLKLVDGDTQSRYKYGLLNESIAIDTVSHNEINKYIDGFDYIFTHNKEFYSQIDKVKFIPASVYWIENPKIHKKNKLVSMISSSKLLCEGHKTRLAWVERLHGKLDLFGSGFNPIEKKEYGLNKYMFSVAIENACYESYFTEKILDCFATGTIPIYLGTPDIGDFFNPDGIISLEEDFDVSMLTEELYYSKMDAIVENFDRVLKYRTVEDFIYENYLRDKD